MADNIQVVGDIFHALAGHLGLVEQACVSEFPAQISLARQVLRDAADGSGMAARMQADVADATAGVKTLVRPQYPHCAPFMLFVCVFCWPQSSCYCLLYTSPSPRD